jgi:hypothetical protein
VGGLGHAVGDERSQQHVLDALAEAADEVAGERHGQDRPRGLKGDAGALDGERDERAGGGQPGLHAVRERAGAGDHAGHPCADHARVSAVAGAHDVLDVEDLDGRRGGDEQQRTDRRRGGDAQDLVAAQQPDAVERPRALLDGSGAWRAAGAQRAGRGGDRQERRRVDEERRAQAQGREGGAQQRPGGQAGRARRFDDAGRLGHAPGTGDGRDQGELGGVTERVGAGQQRRERQDRRQVAAERQRGGDRRLGQRSADQHADALDAVGEEPGHRRQHDRRDQRRREQGRHRQAAAGERVDVQRERDQGQQVAGRRQEHGAGEQAQIA